MQEEILVKLEKNINKLRNILSNCDTESVLGQIANDLVFNQASTSKLLSITGLSSPYKQYLYLGGILLSTEQNKSKDCKKKDLIFIKKLLQKISDLYASMFADDSQLSEDLNQDSQTIRWVSAQVYIHYFNTAFHCTEDQQIERIKSWFTPFEDYIKNNLKISIQELIDIHKYIFETLQAQMDLLFYQISEIENQAASPDKSASFNDELVASLKNIYHIPVEELKSKFGVQVTNKFIEIFSLTRTTRDFYFYTQENPLEKAPIWKISDEYIFCPFQRYILEAIYKSLYELMEKSEQKDQFYKNRDRQVEIQAVNLFKRLFLERASYYTSVFEDNKSHFEHDGVLIYKDTLVIIEAKAFKVREPFREPKKAFKRIQGDFKELQKAFDQGLRLKNLIASQPCTNLYDGWGNLMLTIERHTIKNTYIICVTAESMGSIGCNLSFLLKKPDNEPYPWSCHLYDLEAIIDVFIHKKLTPEEFLDYLNFREKFHSKFLAFYESDIVGSYLLDHDISQKINEDDTYFYAVLPHSPSKVFDDAYLSKKGIGSEVSDSDPAFLLEGKEYFKLFEEGFRSLEDFQNFWDKVRQRNKGLPEEIEEIIRRIKTQLIKQNVYKGFAPVEEFNKCKKKTEK